MIRIMAEPSFQLPYKMAKWYMGTDFNEEKEFRLLEFIQTNYGMEVFTPGLDRTKPIFIPFVELAKTLKVKVIIVAGTNGKGQTAHTLSHLLESSRFHTALWTSPHILSLRERFHLFGGDLSYESLEMELNKTHNFLKKEHSELNISFYEFLFLVFLRLAFNNDIPLKLDHLILEVGLGGRLDAVNHFNADCACITSISRDHQAILGNRYDQIISEKLAVSRPGKPLFTQFKLKYLNQLATKHCEERGVLLRQIQASKNLKTDYFLENQKMALVLFECLQPEAKIPNLEIIPIFKGRREVMTFKGNTLIFIGAHNIDGIRRMIELFSNQSTFEMPEKVLLSFSRRSTNELEIMLRSLVDFFEISSRLVISSFVHPKALELNEIVKLQSKFNKINKGLLDFVTDWKTDLNTSKNQKILVCGSYYFVGEVQRFILASS